MNAIGRWTVVTESGDAAAIHATRSSRRKCSPNVAFSNDLDRLRGLTWLFCMVFCSGKTLGLEFVEYGCKEIHCAITLGDIEWTKTLIQKDPRQAVQPTAGGWLPIHLAARHKRVDLVRLLLVSGAKPNAKGPGNVTALHLSAEQGDGKCVSELLTAGADPNSLDDRGRTALMEAVRFPEIVDLLLRNAAGVNKVGDDGRTALFLAVECGGRQSVAELLRAGAKLDLEDEAGKTALELALLTDRRTIAKDMLSHGARIEPQSAVVLGMEGVVKEYVRLAPRITLRTFDWGDERVSLLQLAARYGRLPIVRLLIDAGADIDSSGEINGRSPLNEAVNGGHSDVVRALLESRADPKGGFGAIDDVSMLRMFLRYGADVNWMVKGEWHYEGRTTLLHIAARSGNLSLMAGLLEAGANAKSLDCFGREAIYWAGTRGGGGAHKAVAMLQSKGGRVDVYSASALGMTDVLDELCKANKGLAGGKDRADPNGRFPIHWAVENRRKETIERLIRHGASVECLDKLGRSPIVDAIRMGWIEGVAVLLGFGANLGVRNELGMTPLHLATGAGMAPIVRVLIGGGAKVDELTGLDDPKRVQPARKVGAGRTALHLACKARAIDVIETLIELGANINAIDDLGRTPLHYAALSGAVPAVKTLLNRGAKIGALDHSMNTPLHLAAGAADPELIDLLLQNGASVASRNSDGKTPLEVAVEGCRGENARRFSRSAGAIGR